MPRRELVRLTTVRVGVPDPTAVSKFFVEALRFHAESDGDGGVALTCQGDYGSPPPASALHLVPTEAAGLRGLTFDIGLDVDLGGYAERLQRRGANVEVAGDTIITQDPDGVEVRLTASRARLQTPLPPEPLRPRRLGHTNLKVPDATRSFAFYADVLGLALSEQIGDGMFFLRAGTEHHNLGIRGGAERADIHHVGFEIAGWESYRITCDHLADLGHTVEYGPGRHGPGNNIFVYLREPTSGLRLELYADMAHIQDDDEYEPPKWRLEDRPRTVNRWGPAPPSSFLE